jgi:hypothetical protein
VIIAVFNLWRQELKFTKKLNFLVIRDGIFAFKRSHTTITMKDGAKMVIVSFGAGRAAHCSLRGVRLEFQTGLHLKDYLKRRSLPVGISSEGNWYSFILFAVQPGEQAPILAICPH